MNAIGGRQATLSPLSPSRPAAVRFYGTRLAALAALVVLGAAPLVGLAGQPAATGLQRLLTLGRVKSNAAQFLPADQVFRLFAEPVDAHHIRLSWEIAPGYYLYRDTLKATTSSTDAKVGPLDLPAGRIKTDDLGTHQVFRTEVVALLPVERSSASAPLTVPVQVTYRGCADAGLCYPPITKTLPISLPAAGGFGGGGSPTRVQGGA
ncbi:MAG: protein-disulfide reductase DsbD N-terminal domain-containing protein, partial [Steroidobacteraceae bacterium]